MAPLRSRARFFELTAKFVTVRRSVRNMAFVAGGSAVAIAAIATGVFSLESPYL